MDNKIEIQTAIDTLESAYGIFGQMNQMLRQLRETTRSDFAADAIRDAIFQIDDVLHDTIEDALKVRPQPGAPVNFVLTETQLANRQGDLLQIGLKLNAFTKEIIGKTSEERSVGFKKWKEGRGHHKH